MIDDPGFIHANYLSPPVQLACQILIQVVLLGTFIVARASRRSSLVALSELERAVRGIAQREALLQEARPSWQFSSNFDIAVSDNNAGGTADADPGIDDPTEDYFQQLSPDAFAAWSVRGLASVSQSINPGDPMCATFSSNIGSPDIVSLTPAL